MQSLKIEFPSLSIETILQWATSNGLKYCNGMMLEVLKGRVREWLIDSKFEISNRIV
jgi:hypothetical protein